MALTVTPVKFTVFGDCFVCFADVTFDSSYATGGESLVSTDFGFSNALTPRLVVTTPASGLMFEYDYTNQKLKAHYPTGGGATAPTTPAAPKVSTGAASATAVDATSPTLTPGTSKEVGNTANLSTVTTRVMAIVGT